MNRGLQWVNFIGVLLLAGLCGVQWRANRIATLEVLRLEAVRRDQAAHLSEQEKALHGLRSDLDEFRERYGHAHQLAGEAENKLRERETEVSRLTAELDQAKAGLARWSEAVSARDEQIKTANQRLLELAADRNQAVQRFNELAAKYNGVVDELNASRTRAPEADPGVKTPAGRLTPPPSQDGTRSNADNKSS